MELSTTSQLTPPKPLSAKQVYLLNQKSAEKTYTLTDDDDKKKRKRRRKSKSLMNPNNPLDFDYLEEDQDSDNQSDLSDVPHPKPLTKTPQKQPLTKESSQLILGDVEKSEEVLDKTKTPLKPQIRKVEEQKQTKTEQNHDSTPKTTLGRPKNLTETPNGNSHKESPKATPKAKAKAKDSTKTNDKTKNNGSKMNPSEKEIKNQQAHDDLKSVNAIQNQTGNAEIVEGLEKSIKDKSLNDSPKRTETPKKKKRKAQKINEASTPNFPVSKTPLQNSQNEKPATNNHTSMGIQQATPKIASVDTISLDQLEGDKIAKEVERQVQVQMQQINDELSKQKSELENKSKEVSDIQKKLEQRETALKSVENDLKEKIDQVEGDTVIVSTLRSKGVDITQLGKLIELSSGFQDNAVLHDFLFRMINTEQRTNEIEKNIIDMNQKIGSILTKLETIDLTQEENHRKEDKQQHVTEKEKEKQRKEQLNKKKAEEREMERQRKAEQKERDEQRKQQEIEQATKEADQQQQQENIQKKRKRDEDTQDQDTNEVDNSQETTSSPPDKKPKEDLSDSEFCQKMVAIFEEFEWTSKHILNRRRSKDEISRFLLFEPLLKFHQLVLPEVQLSSRPLKALLISNLCVSKDEVIKNANNI
eukprot:TRINITY_DN5789_c0_g1_i1.p1 TRINITY_DN5789_c0_g1~~TRINITY_DN5789_c0_g1_i1.p1  ORF type:complete len:644 (+),score=205.81 TRINITY_DN5789_c0_g1_i1:32-1963(+)